MSARRSRATNIAGGLAALSSVAAMIATPLQRKGHRRATATITVVGLAVTTATISARRWGWRRTSSAIALTVGSTWALERVGSRTAFPFGRYRYSGALRPAVGGVPAIVPLAWFAMALPAREASRGLVPRTAPAFARAGAGAMALTAWDLFLDPQMVGEGYWTWARRGRYRGIPASNYAGWLVASGALMAALDAVLPDDDGPVTPLRAQYSYMAVMQTLGFARFFRDRLVAVVGGAAMGSIAVRSWWTSPTAPGDRSGGR
ncbi:MAG: carotenoid biosynthesis protein [Acidimicrobiia bacterium]